MNVEIKRNARRRPNNEDSDEDVHHPNPPEKRSTFESDDAAAQNKVVTTKTGTGGVTAAITATRTKRLRHKNLDTDTDEAVEEKSPSVSAVPYVCTQGTEKAQMMALGASQVGAIFRTLPTYENSRKQPFSSRSPPAQADGSSATVKHSEFSYNGENDIFSKEGSGENGGINIEVSESSFAVTSIPLKRASPKKVLIF